MRILKVAILLLLIAKVSFGMSMTYVNITDSCCSSDEAISITICEDEGNSDTEDKKDCCTFGCECFCCGVTFLSEKGIEVGDNLPLQGYSSVMTFSNNYFQLFLNNIWQPPQGI